MGRRTVNTISLCVTVGFLLLALECGRGEHTSGIQRMTTQINRAIQNVLSRLQDIKYDEFAYTAKYDSSTKFHPKGMNILYNITNLLTVALFPEDVADMIVVGERGDEISIRDDDYLGLAKLFIPLLVFLAVLVLFAVCMPFCGFCFCCCRCCCRSEPKQTEKSRDLCRKIIYATLMIGLGTLLVFGVVCAFVSNEHMQTGTEELTSNLRVAVRDTRKYFNETNSHLELLLDRNYRQLSDVLLETLATSSTILYDELKQITNASSIDDAIEMAGTMNDTLQKLNDLKNLTNVLRVEASQLDDAMRKIKRDLLADLQKCNSNKDCAELKAKYVDTLGTGIDFNSIPDITDDINTITNLKENPENLIAAIGRGKDQLDRLKNDIRAKVDVNIRVVEVKVKDAGKEIRKHSEEVRGAIDRTMDEIVDKSNDGLRLLDDYVDYAKYRYYAGLGVSVVFLLITMFVALGLICGICGKTYNDDCCNKGKGSMFLMCSVTLMFLTSFVLVVILLVHIAGMPVQVAVCTPVRHPNDSKLFAFYDRHADLNKLLSLDTTLKDLVNNCYQNRSVYEVFHLESRFNIAEVREYITRFEIDKELERLEETITLEQKKITLLEPEKITALRVLGSNLSGIHDKFDRIKEEIDVKQFTNVNLDELRNHLHTVIAVLSRNGNNDPLVNSLKLSELHLETYIEKLFKPMVKHAQKTLDLAAEMNEKLKLGHANFQEAINDMADKIEFAQTELSEHGPEKIAEVIRMFANGIKDVIQTYLNRIANSIERDVGQCGPLALVVNGTLTSTCDKILLPMTGFAVSILWCIMLFIPTTIIAIKLADLYKKTEYSRGYRETDFLYDAYADRENIPLARGKYVGKKKHKKKRHEGGRYLADNDMSARDYPGGSQHHDARYSDMAPKQYEDFPNGGPPQYHRATEYERPPPYYCPGSTNH